MEYQNSKEKNFNSNLKYIIAVGLILISTFFLDISWQKMGTTIKSLYLENNIYRGILEIVNDTFKFFWISFPFILFAVSTIFRKPLYKKVSINNIIHLLLILVIVYVLKFTTGRLRPSSATSAFDYNIFSGILTIRKSPCTKPDKTLYRNEHINIFVCKIKDRDSFPSAETAFAFVQALYLMKFTNLKLIIVIFTTFVPILRLSLYRHWLLDCTFSILLSLFIINISEKIRKKYDYNIIDESKKV